MKRFSIITKVVLLLICISLGYALKEVNQERKSHKINYETKDRELKKVQYNYEGATY